MFWINVGYFFSREEKGEQISWFMDCKDAGLKNLEMEFIKFTIDVFKLYSPYSLNYIFVYEMPWVLNGNKNFILIMLTKFPTLFCYKL